MSLLKKSAQIIKEVHSKKLLKKAAQKSLLTQKVTQKKTIKGKIFFTRWNIYYSMTLADEALYYSTI